MNRSVVLVLYAVAMVIVIVSADVLFFRHYSRERLIANLLIVAAFSLVYYLFLQQK